MILDMMKMEDEDEEEDDNMNNQYLKQKLIYKDNVLVDENNKGVNTFLYN
jgi:hypothetical protein